MSWKLVLSWLNEIWTHVLRVSFLAVWKWGWKVLAQNWVFICVIFCKISIFIPLILIVHHSSFCSMRINTFDKWQVFSECFGLNFRNWGSIIRKFRLILMLLLFLIWNRSFVISIHHRVILIRVTVVGWIMLLIDKQFVLVDVSVLIIGLLVQGLDSGVLGELVWWVIPTQTDWALTSRGIGHFVNVFIQIVFHKDLAHDFLTSD